MDKDTTTEEDVLLCLRTQAALEQQQLELPSEIIEALCRGLRGLAQNRTRWLKPEIDDELLCQLAFTLFVPGGRADLSAATVRSLHAQGKLRLLWNTLKQNPYTVLPLPLSGVRFPAQKAERLHSAFANGECSFRHLSNDVVTKASVPAIHSWIVSHVNGMGDKAAAHFMRNTGLQSMSTDFVPIVDTHIRKFVERVEPATKGKPRSLIGVKFQAYCESVKVPGLLVDAAVWAAYAKLKDPATIDFFGFT